MRILHVAPFYEPAWAYGGMARAAAGLCRALGRRGHEVTVATALLDPSHPGEERLGGVRVRRFPGPAFLQRSLMPWARGLGEFLASHLESVEIAHLHGHRNGLAATARGVLRAAGIPWVLQTHGTFPAHGQRRLAKLVFDRLVGDRVVSEAWALVAVSQAEALDLPRSARVVPNGVEAYGRPARLERPGAGRVLLFVGTDQPQKRGGALLHVLTALPETRLHLVGRGSTFRGRFRVFGERVVVRGVLTGEDLAAAYAGADLVVHPAVGEAFGLVPFEAALQGTPAVVAAGHGCGEWFGRAGGCVVPADDLRALVEAVRRRLADPSVGRREAGAVAEFARRELTWERAAEAMESVYCEAMNARGRGAA